mmetsp:Transcript_88563/g.190139  ORF Transcript_88563/g.190139 Transcript_88563/m.190139 type:complete len:210 (-) Transcript_88563:133-762(-)
MSPAHGPRAAPVSECVLMVGLALLRVPRHPMHWQHWPRVLVRDLAACTGKELVHARSDDLVRIELDPNDGSCGDHGPELVKVEGDLTGDGTHLEHDYTRHPAPEQGRHEDVVENHNNDGAGGKDIHRAHEVSRLPLVSGVSPSSNVGDVGLLEPLRHVARPPQVAVHKITIQVRVHLASSLRVCADVLGAGIQDSLSSAMRMALHGHTR